MAQFMQTNGHPARAATYAEAAYFDGYAFAHIAAQQERERLARAEIAGARLARMAAREGGRL
jgi:hypothetical protein